jgi:hypothetical protein
VYKTTDAQDAAPPWALVDNSLPNGVTTGRIEIAIAPSAPQTLYVSISTPNSHNLLSVYKNTTGGTGNWQNLAGSTLVDYLSGQGYYDQTIAVAPTDPNTVYVGGSFLGGQNGVLQTTDGGTTWRVLSTLNGAGPHSDHHAATFDSAGRYLDGCDGGIFRFDPAASRWTSLNGRPTAPGASGALNTNQFVGVALHPTDPNVVYGGTQDNGVDKFNDNYGWTLIFSGDGGFTRVDPQNPNTVYSTYVFLNILKSTNAGASFSTVVNGISASEPIEFYPYFVIDPTNGQRLLVGTNRVYETTNGAGVWNPISTVGTGGWNPGTGTVHRIALAASDPNTIYASTSNGHLFVTTDHGATWVDHPPAAGLDISALTVDPTNAQTAYAVATGFSTGGSHHVWRTTNGGAAWTDITGNLPNLPTSTIALDPAGAGTADDVVYVGNDTGVYRSDVAGTLWARVGGTSLPNVQVADLALNTTTKILAAGTYGRGVWEIQTSPLPPTLTGTVFNDADANGALDPGEAGLAGWQVFNDANNNGKLDTGEPVATTDASGNYVLSLPAAGNYVVREVVQPPFAQTAPASGFYSGTIAVGQTVTNLNFGNTTAVIFTGTKFNDLNGNGARDAGEPGLAGWQVFDDLNGNGTFDSGEPTATTDATGAYRLVAPNPGSYAILEVGQPDWTQLFPASGSYAGTATADQTVSGLDFGNYQAATVSGTVFDDLNGNGSADAGDKPLAGAVVFVDANNNSKLDAGEQSVTTDATGAYSFTLPQPGPYHVRVQLPAGRIVTAPKGAAFSGTPQSGDVITGLDFGTFQTVTISGSVFNDLNGNGVRNPGEPGLRSNIVKLVNTATGAVVATTVTDAVGNFSFTGVGPGTFKVVDTTRTGFTVTSPAGGTFTVTTQSGGNVSGLVFGNLSRALIAVAGGPGSLPVVNLYRASTGQVVNSIMAYDPSFRGGVHVAVGDVNGDGVPDLVTAPGPGGAPHVKVFDGRNGQLIEQFFAYAPTFAGGVWVAAGDFSGDGRADIITGAGAGGGPQVKVFNSRNGQVMASFNAYAPNFTGGVTVAAADVDRDGRADIITGAGAGGGPVIQVFRDRDLALIFRSFAFDPTFGGGVFVSAGDVNGDGRPDVIATPGAGGGAVVTAFNVATGRPILGFAATPPGSIGGGVFFAETTFASGMRVASVDVTGDGIADFVLVPGAGRPGRVRVLDGTTRNEVYGLQQFDPSFLGGVFVGAG